MTDNQTIAPPQLSRLAPLTGSERVRRTRDRKGKDILLVGIELLPTERDKLIRLGFLHKAHRSNRVEVRDAIYMFLEKFLDPPPPSRTEWPLGEWRSNGSVDK
jgi:hypothetical protein